MKKKLIIIGLDGGTFKIIDPLIQDGKLPNLKKLIKTGTRSVLKSTIPPLTPPAWISFMTGTNPGKHGFFDFRKMDKVISNAPFSPRPRDSYNLLHSGYYAGNTLWDILSEAGYKVSVIMMPITYPAWKINGYMISGFPGPDFKNPHTYPHKLGAEIGPLFDLSVLKPNNEDNLINECKQLIKKVGGILLKQLKENAFDVCGVVFSSTDFAQHYLWKYLSDKSSSYSSAIPEMYIQIDKTIGKVLELVEEQSSIIILSDHGFAPCAKKLFHINTWLREEGYLSVKDTSMVYKLADLMLNPIREKFIIRHFLKRYLSYFPSFFRMKVTDSYYKTDRFEWSETKAFRYRLGCVEGIVINLKNRQPNGIVGEMEYEVLREEIIDKLKRVYDPDTGIGVAKEIYKREDIYTGKFLDVVPDIVCVPNPDFMGGIEMEGDVISDIHENFAEALSGTHDSDGVLILKGQKFKRDLNIAPVKLVDLLPTILFDLGLPIPKHVDGRVIREAFEEPYNSAPINYIDTELTEKGINLDLSQEEEEMMKNALEGLGYL